VLSYGHEGSHEERYAKRIETVDEKPFVIASSHDYATSVNIGTS
jgi:hypothetical protein